MSAQRGFGLNQTNADLVRTLGAQTVHAEFGTAICDPGNPMPCPVVAHLYWQVPSAEALRAFTSMPHYNARWLVGGNEPDLEGVRPEVCAALAMAQMDAVSAVDPAAECLITTGSQLHAPHKGQDAYFPAVWAALPKSYQDRLLGCHTHFYPQADNVEWWRPHVLYDYLAAFGAWVGANTSLKRTWLTEVGLGAEVHNDALAWNYPMVVQRKMDQAAASGTFWNRWYWYILAPDSPTERRYCCLTSDAQGTLSEVGKTFASLSAEMWWR